MAAETLRKIVPLVHTAILTATSLLLVSPAAASATEIIIHGRTRNHIANVGNDAEQHEKCTGKASKHGKSGKSKKIKSKTSRPPSTPQPQLRTKKPKSSKSKPTSAPTAPSDPVASPGKIFITISANFTVRNITVEQRRRRQLAVTVQDITTIMEETIYDVVRSSLNADQSIITVNITGIDDVYINGSPAGTTIYSQFILTENCTTNCEAQLSKTTMNITVISFMTEEIDNGNFTRVFQENADAQCATTTCQDIKNGKVVRGFFNETIRGVVAIPSSPTAIPTKAPTANPATLTPASQPTTVSPTNAAPTTSVPTTESPTRTPVSTCDGGLEPSPIICPSGFICLQNCDFGNEDPTRFNIDLSLELSSTVDTRAAYVSALAKWMDVITGDLPARSSSAIGADEGDCTNALPIMLDDAHICGKDETIDGVGKVLGSAGPRYARLNQTTGKLTTVTGIMR